jgi:sigma-B regulation protein RsbU (phosphoserine phosphatase)
MTPSSGVQARVLIADDQADVRAALRLLLKGEGHQTEAAASPAAVLEAVQARPFDLVLMDLNYSRDTTSGQEGLELLERLRVVDDTLPVMVMTAWGTIELAVEAMRRGARDFMLKPWDNAAVLRQVRAQVRGGQTQPAPEGARAAAERKAAKDLALAGRVQGRLLPGNALRLETLDCAGLCEEAGVVGGDFYDFLPLGPGRFGLVLADVSGKGVSAALLMANLQASLRSQCSLHGDDPARVMREVNRLFFASTAPEHYATAFFGVYDDRTRRLRYANCGHLPPVVARGQGVLRLAPTGPVIGMLPEWDGTCEEIMLEPGDRFLVFSDGLTEAANAGGEEFGDGRVVEFLQAHPELFAAELPAALLEALAVFRGAPHDDDVTVVAARAH